MRFEYPLQSKLPRVQTTIFTIMSALAREHGAINLAQGFPDFDPPALLTGLVTAAMGSGKNQYAPMAGLGELREAIAEKTAFLYGAEYNPDTEITVTAGATQAIYTAIAAVVSKGDQVIVIEPAYDCYVPAIELSGGIPRFARLSDRDYSVDWDEIRRLINPDTRVIIINTPHNPTGSLLTPADMHALETILSDTGIILISDEVYEHIIFDGADHASAARFPALASRSFIISSFGKSYHATGWKVGYVAAPENLMSEFRKVHQYNVFAVNTPMQSAYAGMLKERSYYLELGAFYQRKRDYFRSLLEGSRFTLMPAAGTYFQVVSYERISDEKDTDLAARMTREVGVAPIPMSAFYSDGHDPHCLRFCFAKSDETLERAAEKLVKM